MEARKYSKKRQAILDALRNTTEHPSAEMLYARLKPEYPDLSLGTVYRNLAMFIRDGDVISVGTVSGQERYDANTKPHAHFICTCCGKVEDLPMAAPAPALLEDAGRLAEATVTGYQLQFTGLCSGCNKKSEPKN